MGQLVAELRKVYVTAKAEATPILEDILGEGSLQSIEKETTEIEAVGKSLLINCNLLPLKGLYVKDDKKWIFSEIVQ